MAGMSIFDMQAMKDTNFEKGIVETFIRESDVSRILEFNTINTTQIQTRRMNSLPEVRFRARGERYFDGGMPRWETVTDTVASLGAEITIDKVDKMDKGPYIQNPLSFNAEAKIKAMKYKFHDAIINGDHAVDPQSFEGLKVRIANLASSQTVYAVNSTTQLECRPGTLTSANAYAMLYAIENAVYALDGHKADYCLTDADFIRALKNALRVVGAYVAQPGTPTTKLNQRETSNEIPGGFAFEWDGVKYIDMGVKADQTTKIVATDTISVACRPAYFIKTGGNFLTAIQMQPLETSDLFLLDDGVSHRMVIDWMVGLRHVHNRFASVLKGCYVA